MRPTPQERVNRDLDAVLDWTAEVAVADTSRVAVLGFCYGGGKALRYTTQARPDAATVVFYGTPLTDAAEVAALRAPVCAIFGGADLQIPQPTVDAFRRALEEARIENEVVTYPGAGHAFFSDVKQIEREEMPMIDAFRVTSTFLRQFFEGAR